MILFQLLMFIGIVVVLLSIRSATEAGLRDIADAVRETFSCEVPEESEDTEP